jgi:hypothetical protein
MLCVFGSLLTSRFHEICILSVFGKMRISSVWLSCYFFLFPERWITVNWGTYVVIFFIIGSLANRELLAMLFNYLFLVYRFSGRQLKLESGIYESQWSSFFNIPYLHFFFKINNASIIFRVSCYVGFQVALWCRLVLTTVWPNISEIFWRWICLHFQFSSDDWQCIHYRQKVDVHRGYPTLFLIAKLELVGVGPPVVQLATLMRVTR